MKGRQSLIIIIVIVIKLLKAFQEMKKAINDTITEAREKHG